MSKYLVLFLIPNPLSGHMRLLADRVAAETDTHPPYLWLTPHITLHRPIITNDEDALRRHVTNAIARAKQSRITFSGTLDCSENKHIVLPAQATQDVASLWLGIHEEFANLPGYTRGEYNNTLHTVIADVTTDVCNRVWPTVQGFRIERAVIPLREVALYRKPLPGGRWEPVASFPIPA